MASWSFTSRLSPVTFSPKCDDEEKDLALPAAEKEANSDEEFLTGTQFAEKQQFNKRGRQLGITPLIVDFRRLLTSSSSSISVIPGVRLVLHA
jgi:hypothetical protein